MTLLVIRNARVSPYALVITLFLALFLCVLSAPSQAAKEDAGKFVETLGKNVLEMISNENFSEAQKKKNLETIFEKHVDIDWIAQFVLGKHWRAASDEQKQAYLINYHKFLLLNYTSNFENFADSHFEIVSAKDGNKSDEYMVEMVLKRKNQQDLNVNYRLREDAKSGYQVIDIIAEGISLLTSQRSEFNSVVSREGLDSLIEQLKNKTMPPAQ